MHVVNALFVVDFWRSSRGKRKEVSCRRCPEGRFWGSLGLEGR